MRRLLLVVLPLLMALPASAADGSAMATYTHWKNLRDPGTSAISFSDGLRFLTQHPDWPQEKIIRLRTEAAALAEHAPPFGREPTGDEQAILRDYCANFPPISGRGMVACFLARAGVEPLREQWLHQGWIQGDFTLSEEDMILREFGTDLKSTDHIARIERLLYEGKTKPAERMMELVPRTSQALYHARIALITNQRNAESKMNGLSASERRNAGLLFDRMGWRMRHHQEDRLAELFLLAPSNVPYADLWWPMRAMAAREALNNKNFSQALAILDHHGDMKGEALADALWLKGWIILKYRHDPATAYREFYALYTHVKTPVSKARAAYWAARAATLNNNPDIAQQWYEKAAAHPTVFYGQLAHVTLHPDAPLPLPEAPRFTDAEKTAFDEEDLVRVARALDRAGDKEMRDLFLTSMGIHAEAPSRFAMLASLAHELGGTAAEVGVAKLALRKEVLLIDSGWPRIRLPESLAVEPALALSITRQESEFDPLAKSPANARGMMQLLPSTARHVAKQQGWRYSDAMLNNPQENITLGSTYLGQIISGFDGSYILGIASYNAGPANVRDWLRSMGRPPKTVEGAIDWIESIPYGETRNYVMRGLENLQIYRTLLQPDDPLQLTRDLVR